MCPVGRSLPTPQSIISIETCYESILRITLDFVFSVMTSLVIISVSKNLEKTDWVEIGR